MKCILLCLLCINVYMLATAQTDSTAQKDTSSTILVKTSAVKNLPAFSSHMFTTYQLPNNSNRFYTLPGYQTILRPSAHKGQTVYQIAGYMLLSILADKNHYIYNYTPPKNKY